MCEGGYLKHQQLRCTLKKFIHCIPYRLVVQVQIQTQLKVAFSRYLISAKLVNPSSEAIGLGSLSVRFLV